MKIQELYDHITSQLTPEEALKRLLESSLLTYEKLKFGEGETPVHPIIIISMATMDLGWGFLVEKEQEHIRGMVIGTNEYLNTSPK